MLAVAIFLANKLILHRKDLSMKNYSQAEMKRLAAAAAVDYIKKMLNTSTDGVNLGVGSGSTIAYFIEELAKIKPHLTGVISSSQKTTDQLNQMKIKIDDLNAIGEVDIYVDSADEINHHFQMIKGGGGALTKEKIISNCSKKTVCIVDETKYVNRLGEFPLPVEVIPIARSYVGREIVKLGGLPNWRQGVVTDNGNWILDIYNINMSNPVALEEQLNNITGIVTCGLFAKNPAHVLILAKANGVIDILNRN